MRPSVLYSNAIIAVRENLLLNYNQIKRMIAANSFADAAYIFFECGYDESVLTSSGDNEDHIINDEAKRCVELFQKLCPDANVLAAVLAKYDYHNARVLYKSRFCEISIPEATFSFGSIPLAKIERAISRREYAFLPKTLKSALGTLDNIQTPTANEIDTQFDQPLHNEIKGKTSKINSESIRQYFLRSDETFLKHAGDVFCLEKLLKWFIMKQRELKIVKAILMGKKLGASRDKIRELVKGVQ